VADAVTRTFQTTIARIGDRAAALTARQWAALGNWDEADVEAFARASAPTLQAAKDAAVQSGRGYYAVRAKLLRPPTITSAMVDVAADPREPFIAYWRALKSGNPIDAAIESGTARAGAIARNLASSASRRTADVLYSRADVYVGRWVRVPDANACDWCQLIAEGNGGYKSAETADFGHDRCNCTAEPMF
jgi:hypothetical protein